MLYIMNYNINGIIKFQRMFKFMKNEFELYNIKRNELSEKVYSMNENLDKMNEIKLFENNKDSYKLIFGDIENLTNKFNLLPNNLSFKTFRKLNKTIDDINVKLYELSREIDLYMNHITSTDIRFILLSMYGKDFYYKFSYDDYNMIVLLERLLLPINLWDSELHKNKIPHIKDLNNRMIIKRDSIDKLLDLDENSTSLIVSDQSLPIFLNKLSEYIVKEGNKNNTRITIFDKDDVADMFLKTESRVLITDNYFNKTFIESYRGVIVHIKITNEKFVCIQGLLKNNNMNIFKNHDIISEKLTKVKKHINYNILTVPKKFKSVYLENISLKEILVGDIDSIALSLKNKYNEYKKLKNKNLKVLINDFLLSSKYRKVDTLLTLLYSQEDDMLAYLLYDIMVIKDKKNITQDILNALPIKLRNRLDVGKEKLIKSEKDLMNVDVSDISYERRISLLDTNDNIKSKAISKLKSIKNNMQGDSKAQDWLDGLLKIPFGVYKTNSVMDFKNDFKKELNQKYNIKLFSTNDINDYITNNGNDEEKDKWDDYIESKKIYLDNVRSKLDNAVYGHDDAKKQLERVFAQWINGDNKGEVLGLWGPPGTGKTSLAKHGLSKCLIDDSGESRPFAFLPIGGSVNGSTLVGHNYTYVGSTWGRIVDILITTNCMNPIIFIDELDKISNTENGREISSILTHLTDLTQNDTFEDKYFSGIPFDLSKALIVFSFNDIDRIDPILKDRITVIETKAFTIEDKVNIIRDYMLPELLKENGYNCNEILFSEDMIRFIIKTYTHEAGVRKIKEKLMEIIREVNLHRLMNNINNGTFEVTKEYVEELFKTKPKMRVKKICPTPQVGFVNGLYATTSGIGGLTVIQIMKFPSDKMLELHITGQQGDVMKESVNYALRIAYSLLTEDEQNKIISDNKDGKNFGLHIHTPDAATKKDGPSAGAAMTLAIYSILTGKQINNEVALTGEIDLMKNVTAIGGVYAKLNGAKEAGVKKALIPKENLDDLNILREKGISPEDDNFTVVTVETIEEVLDNCLV
jgi:ATP-dependent Lon protease